MNKMIAYCGLVCDTCYIHLATLEQDKSEKQKMRTNIAQYCNEHFNMGLKPEDVRDCDGCKAETGRLFSECENCEVRKCAIQRDLDNCAYCNDYICDKLEKMFVNEPDAKVRLEEIRNSIGF